MNELISRALQLKRAKRLFAFPETLMNDFERDIVAWIRKYSLEYGRLPTRSRLARQFPMFVPVASSDPISDVFDECIRRKRQIVAQTYVGKINAAISDDEDPSQLFSDANSILSAASSSMLTYSSFDRQAYFKRKKFLPFGIKIIDSTTGGLGNGELCYIAGRLGSYKTTLVEHIAFSWWLHGYRVLFISNEALPISVFSHLDAIAGKFNPSVLRSAKIPDDIKRKILKVASRVMRNGKHYEFGEIIVPNERLLVPSQVFALASYLKVDAIIVDGVYLMYADGSTTFSQSWENMTAVSRALKQGALSLGTRVLGILQRKRGSDETQRTEDIAYADAFPQDADIVISVFKEKNLLTAEIIKNREGLGDIGTVLEIDHEKRRLRDLGVNTHEMEEINIGQKSKRVAAIRGNRPS